MGCVFRGVSPKAGELVYWFMQKAETSFFFPDGTGVAAGLGGVTLAGDAHATHDALIMNQYTRSSVQAEY